MAKIKEGLFLSKFRKVVILSPHPDDVAYSIGGSVYLLSPECDCTILTVFSRSIYAPVIEINSNESTITKIRNHEEREYAKTIGVKQVSLNFPDASVLGYTAESELEADYTKDERFDKVSIRIHNLINQFSPELILSPVAIGGHIDHQIVFQSIRTNFYNIPTLYYEDLPYASYFKQSQLLNQIKNGIGHLANPILINIVEYLQQKLDNLSIYKSQLIEQDKRAILNYANSLSSSKVEYFERLWNSP
jgi:LmbE family N-acetylglucosaminyl deacetylase